MNGAFRPKGGNGVHGLFDDAGECHEVTRGLPGGAISNRPVRGSGSLLPGHCEPVRAQRKSPWGTHWCGNPFSWQKTSMFHRTLGAAGQQSLPCVKGGGVRKDTGGIDAEHSG